MGFKFNPLTARFDLVGAGGTSTPITQSSTLGIVVDNGTDALTTGLKGYYTAPYTCTINKWRLTGDTSGSIVFDIWKKANAIPTVTDTIITSGTKPSLSSSQITSSDNLTGWITSVTSGDVLAYNVDSSSTIRQIVLILEVTK
jgi:hypothetical protein